MGGIYTAENPDSKLSRLIGLSTDILQGTPSIVIGIFAWVIAVVPFGHFSGVLRECCPWDNDGSHCCKVEERL